MKSARLLLRQMSSTPRRKLVLFHARRHATRPKHYLQRRRIIWLTGAGGSFVMAADFYGQLTCRLRVPTVPMRAD